MYVRARVCTDKYETMLIRLWLTQYTATSCIQENITVPLHEIQLHSVKHSSKSDYITLTYKSY
jgi:hypothetical protein